MNEIQNKYLQYLKETISSQQSNTKQHIDEYRKVFANNRNSAGLSNVMKEFTFTQCIKKGDGGHVIDLNDNRLLDVTMGFGVHLFGHKVPFLDAAIKSQIDDGMVLGPLYETAAQVAQLLNEMTGSERSAFFNSGTEAVMVAMRLAKAARGKENIVIFKGCYHGTCDSFLAMKSDRKSNLAKTTIPGVPDSTLSHTVLLDYGAEESLDYLIRNHRTIAAVLTEPVQSRHPHLHNKLFLQKLRTATKENDIALIFDEVITGFRTCNGGASEHFSIEPDIVIYGKILGGGMPIGVVAGKKEYLDYIDGGGDWVFGDTSMPASAKTFVAGTFCHHPLAMAAAQATLEHLKKHEGEIQKKLNNRTETFSTEINAFFKQQGFPIEVVHFSSLFRFIAKGRARYLFYALLKEGAYIWEGRNCFFSTAHTDNDIAELLKKIKKVCFELYAAELLVSNKKIEKPFLNRSYTQIATKLDATVDIQCISIAAKYLIASTPALSNHEFIIDVVSRQSNSSLDTHLSEAQLENQSDIKLTILKKETSIICLISFSSTLCDGWSLTMFFRDLETCYRAMTEGRLLPGNKFLDQGVFDRWLGHTDNVAKRVVEKARPSQTIFRTITKEKVVPHFTKPTFFTYLLGRFMGCFDSKEVTVAVPIAGQLLARKLRIFGACNYNAPILIETNEPFSKQLEAISEQLSSHKKNFKQLFVEQTNSCNVIFNYDNLKSGFFEKENLSIYPLNEQFTRYNLVCNVIDQGGLLTISVKYDPSIYDHSYVTDITNRYITSLENIKLGEQA